MTITISDVLIILATLTSPVIAVQVQKWLERRREGRAGKLWIFRTLMATRAARIAPQHVEALNMIDVEFYGGKRSNKRVREAWKEYFEQLHARSKDPTEQKLIFQRQEDLFINLLYEMALAVGFDFDKTHIRTHIYSPVGHGEIELDQTVIRRGLAQVFLGQRSIPMVITAVPPEDESQREFREQYTKFIQSGKAWPVQIVPPAPESGPSAAPPSAPPDPSQRSD